MQPDLSRRAVLSATLAVPAAAIPVAASAVAATNPDAASAVAATNPDAELLAAWEAYIQANRDFDRAYAAMPDGGTEEEHEPYLQVIDLSMERLARLPARTPAGVAVKLHRLLAAVMESEPAFRTFVYGEPITAELARSLEDYRYAMMWRLIQDVERMAVASEA